MGMQHEQQFQRYHRVLNRMWSSRQASRLLLQQLVSVFAPSGASNGLMTRLSGAGASELQLRVSIVTQSVPDSHLVKASGLRWLSLML